MSGFAQRCFKKELIFTASNYLDVTRFLVLSTRIISDYYPRGPKAGCLPPDLRKIMNEKHQLLLILLLIQVISSILCVIPLNFLDLGHILADYWE